MNKMANFSKNVCQILEISLKTHLLNIFCLDVLTSVKVKVHDYPENDPLNNYMYNFFRPHNIPPYKSKCRIQWSYYTVHWCHTCVLKNTRQRLKKRQNIISKMLITTIQDPKCYALNEWLLSRNESNERNVEWCQREVWPAQSSRDFRLGVLTLAKVKVHDYPENAPLNNYLYNFFRPHNIPPYKSKCRIQWSYYTVHWCHTCVLQNTRQRLKKRQNIISKMLITTIQDPKCYALNEWLLYRNQSNERNVEWCQRKVWPTQSSRDLGSTHEPLNNIMQTEL